MTRDRLLKVVNEYRDALEDGPHDETEEKMIFEDFFTKVQNIFTPPNVIIKCANEACDLNGKVINTATTDDPERFLEAYGHGSEDPIDHCPKCKELGVACPIEEV